MRKRAERGRQGKAKHMLPRPFETRRWGVGGIQAVGQVFVQNFRQQAAVKQPEQRCQRDVEPKNISPAVPAVHRFSVKEIGEIGRHCAQNQCGKMQKAAACQRQNECGMGEGKRHGVGMASIGNDGRICLSALIA